MRKLATGKSEKYTEFFDRWLALMEEAFDVLTEKAFFQLEEKIKAEIRAGRRD